MASKMITAKQAKRYDHEERKKFIDEYFNSDATLTNFCKIKGRPSYKTMKLWLNTSSTIGETTSHPFFTSSTLASDNRKYPTELQLIQSIASRITHLEIRLAAIKQELERLTTPPSSDTHDYHHLH